MSEPASDHPTRPSLLVRLRDASDGQSWQTFVQTYAPVIYGRCRRVGLQDADAADVTQEVLLQAAQALRTFVYQAERGRFRDWLGLVTRRRLARFFGKQVPGTDCPGLDEVAAAGTDAEWTAEFQTHVLKVALERIRPHFEPVTWRLFELTWLEDRPAAEVAAELQTRVEAVYVAKSRVLKMLRDEVLLLAEDLPQCVPLD